MPGYVDPLDLFRAAVIAVNSEDWGGAAALCDPVSLRAFRRQLIEQFAPLDPTSQITVDAYLQHSPDMPREVAEYHVSQARVHADPAERLRRELPGVADAAALAALGPEQAFASWLDGRSPRRQVERLAAEGRITPRAAASAPGMGAFHNYEPLGAVPDGESITFVLFRHALSHEQSWSGEAAKWLADRPEDEQELARQLWDRHHPKTATCRRQPDGTWRLIADHEFMRIASVQISHVHWDDAASDTDAGAP